RGLNIDAKPRITNAKPTTDAYKAAADTAATVTRQALDTYYTEHGVDNVAEARGKEADLIYVAEKIGEAQKKADEMGQPSIFKSTMAKIGVPSTVIAIALGHPIGIPAIAASVAADLIHQRVVNPLYNLGRAA